MKESKNIDYELLWNQFKRYLPKIQRGDGTIPYIEIYNLIKLLEGE